MTNGERYAHTLMMHRGALLDLLELIPTDKGDFAAWDGGMSFHKLADHLSASTNRMPTMIAGETPAKAEPSADFATARENMKASTENARALLAGLSDEQTSSIIEAFGGRKMPVSALVEFLISHEAHHKGQAWMMARMIGIEPPRFVKM
jgi:uncharacterized damage-inducible protein DinB